MLVRLRYGSTGLTLTVPRTATVLKPTRVPALADPVAAVREALAGVDPARLGAGDGRRRAAIVVSDVTRLMPNAAILGPLLDLLARQGIERDDVTIVIATGLHRASRPEERQRILGPLLARRCRVVDHVARDPATLAYLGTTARGTRVEVNRDYLEAEVRILTGFVEPHLFAGFSGGGKAVLPGIAGVDAILASHGPALVAHPRATWCETTENPIFQELRAAGRVADPAFIVNVTLDEERRLTGVFAGGLEEAHDAAITAARRQAEAPLAHRCDIVVATNMGYPADLNLYQSVKGLSLAARACADGGTVILCAECREGLGGPEYVALLERASRPAAFLADFEREPPVIDGWQVQIQAQVQRRVRVLLHASLSAPDLRRSHLEPAPDVSATLTALVREHRRAHARAPRVCVIPYGQLTVPMATT